MAGGLAVDTINGHNIAGGFLGTGQTWQDVKTSRSAGVTYTNSTGKPIEAAIVTYSAANTFSINGKVVGRNNGSNYAIFYGIIPDGGTYVLSAGTLDSWSELR